MHSAQRSQIDPGDMTYECNGPPSLPNDSSMQSSNSGFFGHDSGISVNEQTLVGMQGHTVAQYGDASSGSTGYGSQNLESYADEPSEPNCYSSGPGSLLNVLSEAAGNLDYSLSTSFMSAPRRLRCHASGYEHAHGQHQECLPEAHFSCQHPGSSNGQPIYGHQHSL